MSNKTTANPVGATWNRWEPHIHTPGTVLSDAYGGSSLDDFLTKLETAVPAVTAVGITDYYVTQSYESVLQARQNGRLPDVDLVFCNIEMRLSIETKAGKGVNLHLLASPTDPDHVLQLNRFLSNLTFHYGADNFNCTRDDLILLGKRHDPTILDDNVALTVGATQFKVDFNQLRKLWSETAWARENILVAVAGSSNDGTAGLQDETQSFAASRKEIEAFSHIIFTATPKNIEFWRGEGKLSSEELLSKYNGAKPCLHGSDAHRLDRVAVPDEDRRCWIKGDVTFESLRQACLEPRLRAYIGAEAPTTDTPFSVESVATATLPWLLPDPLPINPGMVAIIGARGSGKTALADLIAHAGDSPFPTGAPQSFLSRVDPFLGADAVTATWSGAPPSSKTLRTQPSGMPDVHYLTQQFVDRLCSSVGQSDELLDEVKRVVFLAHDPASRMGTDNFDALAELRSSETRLAVENLNQRLDRLSQDVLVERNWHFRRASLEKAKIDSLTEMKKLEASRQEIIKPGGADRAEYYTRLSAAIDQREQAIQGLSRQQQLLRKLAAEGKRYEADVFPQLQSDLMSTYSAADLSTDEWVQFSVAFTGNPASVVSTKLAAQEVLIKTMTDKSGGKPTASQTPAQLDACALQELQVEQAFVGQQIALDKKNLQRLQQLNGSYKTQQSRLEKVTADLARADESKTRLPAILSERAGLYRRFFELVVQQCEILMSLYTPLKLVLAGQQSSARKLALRVVREVDLAGWGQAGESLLDLRKNGAFRGRGAVADAAREALLPAWKSGSAQDVAAAMETFRTAHDGDFLAQSPVERESDDYEQWVIDLGRWLYSTSHISVQYSIEYESVPITQLSPGTRGIVLLLLYLALDLEDSRPLIIDQPEENLDPKSIQSELVELFLKARMRRQVIIVTHNANLVVNTDVDQVIVASCIKTGEGTPPEFHYLSGGLERPEIRAQVCDILEGGESAFKQRAKRLRVTLED